MLSPGAVPRGPPTSVRAEEVAFAHRRSGQLLRRRSGSRSLEAQPASNEGAQHGRVDHSSTAAHHDPVSRIVSNGLARFTAPLRSTGVDGAYRPVAPARALARCSALLAGGDAVAHGRPRRPDERLRAVPRDGCRHGGRPAPAPAGSGAGRSPEPLPESEDDADRLCSRRRADASVRLWDRSSARGRAPERRGPVGGRPRSAGL